MCSRILSHKLSVELSSMAEENLSMRFMLINSCTTIYLLYENHAHYKTIYYLTKTQNPIKSIKIYNSTRRKHNSFIVHHILASNHIQLEGKYSLESTDPRESEIRAPSQLTIALKLTCYLFIIAKLFKVKDSCLKFVYIGKNPQFTAFLDSNLHTRLATVTGKELGLAFPPRNLPKKFRPDPSTFYLVIVVTDKHTDRQMYADDSIIPRESFRGDNENIIRQGIAIDTALCTQQFRNSCNLY